MKKIILITILLFTIIGCQKIEVNKELTPPTNLTQVNNIISFDEVIHATSYILWINGEEHEIITNSYTLGLYGDFVVKVKAKADGYIESPYSNEIMFTLPMTFHDVRFNYSVHSDFDLHIYTFEEEVTTYSISGVLSTLESTDFYITDQKLYLKSAYLKELTPQLYILTVSQGSIGSFTLTLSIVETEIPYIVSYNTVQYEQEDSSFQFELFGGSILRLSGNDITSNEYIIDGNILTIKSTYIDTYFSSNPDQTSLSLKYDLYVDDTYVFGYIFINK